MSIQSKVSILIPTYNRVQFIYRAIESSLKQTYRCEVIVCDHGSNDGTEELCLTYGNEIKYIRRDNDYGIHFCELEALLASNGEYVHFCFDDDWMHPEFIEQSIKLFNEETGLVFSSYEVIDIQSDNPTNIDWDLNKQITSRRIRSILKIPYVMRGLISPSCALVRKQDAIKCMYMTTNLLSDSYYNGVGPDWLITAMPLFKYKYCGIIDTSLVKFGSHDKSITVDAYNSKNILNIRRFTSAYRGARLYLLVSCFVKFIKLELIYLFLEDSLRVLKRFAIKMIKW